MSKFLTITSISLFTGLIAGALSSGFLYSLSFVTSMRIDHPYLIWGLPIFGFFFGIILKKIPNHINQGVPYILAELENDNAKVSPWMTPFIFISSILTHLFGGSVGREGVGVIMGASAAHLLPKFSSKFNQMRSYLIYGGIAAGFSSIFGTPIAAIIFAFELHSFKHTRKIGLILCTSLSSFIAFMIPHYLGPKHQSFDVMFNFNEIIPYMIIVGFVSGLGSLIFYWGLKEYTKLISKFLPDPKYKLGIGGLLISLLVYATNSYEYIGIGTNIIAKSFILEMNLIDFLMKLLLTVMTLSIGFKGGEVTPLFFMGSTLANATCSLFNLKNFSLSSGLGMVALFGAVTGTPIASAIMGAELFGPEMGGLCLVSCLMARFIMKGRTVYRL